ncbi:MAG: hypothetical protein IT518_14850 [Burkholderiales bacterium]|nr:hypothetical protein [Burkholderiales bacterium]
MPEDHPCAVVIRRDRIVAGRGTVVHAAGANVTLFLIDGIVHAIDDACLRCGESLGAGRVAAGLAICTGCGWAYDIASGAVQGVPALCVERYAVRVDDANVFAALPAPPLDGRAADEVAKVREEKAKAAPK